MKTEHELFVTGRLCLFGEHSDWAGALRSIDPDIAPGACLVCGTDQGLKAIAAAAPDLQITSHLPGGESRHIRLPMQLAALREAAAAGGFFSYAAGVAAEMAATGKVGGLRLEVIDMDLPLQRGLSSSAAICVLTARAFGLVYDLGLSLYEEMDLAYRGEIAAGSECGRMDQACAFGGVPVILQFDGEVPEVQLIRPGGVVPILIVDLCSHKDTRRILSDLQACFRGTRSPIRDRLRDALGIENQAIVTAARSALLKGDSPQLGMLMNEAQALFDRAVAPASPAELAAPKLHAVLAAPSAHELAWGGKGVGSQGDGTAQFVCRGVDERRELARRLRSEFAVECLDLTIAPAVGAP